MAVLEDVAVAVEELLAGSAVRWPDPPDVHAELVAVLLLASPETAARVVATLQVLLEQAEGLGEFLDHVDAVAIRFGQDGDGETCAALLDIGDRLREWREQ
jgi:hypothetical protein